VLEFGRYSQHCKPIDDQTPMRASRVQLGEIIDINRRPANRYTVPDAHMKLYNSYSQATPMKLGDMVENAGSFHEFSKTEGQRIREELSSLEGTPIREISCPGLHIRKHPFVSTPGMGIRKMNSPERGLKGTVSQPEWNHPMEREEFTHMRPFENATFGRKQQPFVVSGALPDSKGHWTGMKVYSEMHATQAMDQLNKEPHRFTEWSKQNIYNRTQTFVERRLASVSDKPLPPTLFLPTSQRLQNEDILRAQEIRAEIDAIREQRDYFEAKSCGKTHHSKSKNRAAKQKHEAIRRARSKKVRDHMDHHSSATLAYRIAFDKFDEDKSGSIDAIELQGALHHMGLDVPDEGIETLLARYDEDGNGSLDFEEFAHFAKDAQMDPDAKSLFIRKEVMLKYTG
jgi:hypothetical protein